MQSNCMQVETVISRLGKYISPVNRFFFGVPKSRCLNKKSEEVSILRGYLQGAGMFS